MKKIKKVIHEYTSLDASLFRYSLSYCFLLALLPTLIIVVFLIQNSAYTIDELLVFLYQYLPEELLSPFVRFILNRNYPSFLSLLISLILSCYLASKSFYSFMLISATHEKINTYKLLIRIRSFVMFVVFISGIFFLALITYSLKDVPVIFYTAGIILLLYILYRMLSFERRPLSYGLLGAFVSGVLILVVGFLFWGLVNDFTSYKSVYGPLSSLVILLLSIYVISSIIYFGYCLNLVYGKRYDRIKYKSALFFMIGEKVINHAKQFIRRREE